MKNYRGHFIYESKHYAEMSVTSDDGNEKDRVDAVCVDLTKQNIDRDKIESEKKTKVYAMVLRIKMINMIYILN